MKHRRLPFIASASCALAFAAPVAVHAQKAPAASSSASSALQSRFTNPPASAKPQTWWHWMNGNSSKQGITADLEAMASVGMGGAQIFNVDQGIPAGTVPYMSAEWRDQMAWAAREAKRLVLSYVYTTARDGRVRAGRGSMPPTPCRF